MTAKVLCGAACGKTPVFAQFYDFFYGLTLPEGSVRGRVEGGSIPNNLNRLVEMMGEHDCTHLFHVEDDSLFAPDTVMRLLAHNVPVVAGLCRARHAPFKPYIYAGYAENPEEGLADYVLTPKDHGLIKVGATGMGGILIHRDVFARLERPYFTHYHVGERLWGQDLVFGKKLIDAGVEVFCDLDVTIWHKTDCLIGTTRDEGGNYRAKFTVDQADFTVNT